MAFAEDLDPYFADFGENCTIAGVAQTGLFDKQYLSALGIVAGNDPVLLLKDSAVGAAVEGTAVVIRSINYTVATVEPDGTGLSLLRLDAS
jgi:hypothetical protein